MKSLIVSVHDFTPKYHVELEEILSELDSRGFKKRSLLVVPNYEDAYPINKFGKSVYRLIQEKISGNEICLHGYNHGKGFRYREFKDINFEDAMAKLSKGKRMLRNEGIYLSGFVPPFWKISDEGERAVEFSNFSFLVKNPEIKDFMNNNIYYSKPLWFWPYNLPVDYAFRLFDSFLARVWAYKDDLVRVEFHPQDLYGKNTFEFGLKLLGFLSKDRNLTTYRSYLKLKTYS
ncbi:MAG: DUF2334 domain-containing protein [Candidatus Nanoarchaeia archaeon]